MQRTLSSEEKIILEAEEIPIFKRKEIISAKKETELHKLLSKLFSAMEPDHNVVITHGSNEYGKDLVIISNDKFGSTTRAAVVKCGAISGQATKEIDEILSQTRMAFKHPYSPNGIDEYHVSEVIVVASGRITENAKKRINSELNENNIKLYDLDKLVDLFTTYYPRIFFGGLEHDYASQQIERLDQVRAFSGRTGSLRNLFVEQTLKSTAVSTKTSGTFSTSKKSVRYKELPALIRKKKRVALVGEAGSGKTSLLKMLAIDSLRNYKNALLVDDANTPSVSLFCEAKSVLEHDKSTSLLAFLRDLSSCPETVQIGTVLVDGLDEIKLEKRKDVINALDLLLAEGLSVVISSRCEDTFEATEWARYEIAPMTTGQALTLCEKVVSDECLSLTLKESIKDIKKRITLTPLAIFLLLEIIEEHQEVPASLTELYDQYVDNVLGKHDKEKAIESLFEYESKKRFLAEIAYGELVQKDVDLISIKDFERIGQRFFKEYEWPWSSWVTLVDELKRSSLVFIDEEAGMLHFRHRSFLEYFAAYALYVGEQGDNVGISCAIEYYFDPQWTDIAFYYFGLKKSMSSEIMTQIFAKEDSSPFMLVQKMRSGRLLQACWHSKASTKRQGLLQSSQYAAKIRNKFINEVIPTNPEMPLIIADLILVSIADESYRSVFLKNQVKAILNEESFENDDQLLGALCLYSATASLFAEEDQIQITECLMTKLKGRQDRQFEGRGYFYLLIAAGSEKNVKKTIERRLKKFINRYGSVLKGLLPAPSKTS